MLVPIPTRSEDTDPEADRVQIALLRSATPGRRAGLALSLTATVIGLARLALARASFVTTPDVLTALHPVAEAFERLGVRYYVGRSLASSARGLPRATRP